MARRRTAAAKGRSARTRAGSATFTRPVPRGTAERKTGSEGRSQNDAPEREALVVTHWFDSGGEGLASSPTIRLIGRRVGVTGKPGPGDSFTHEEAVEGILPGTGPVSVTSWVYGLEPGEWNVSGQLIRSPTQTGSQRTLDHRTRTSTEPLRRAAWSWRRWALSASPETPVKTRWALLAPLARMPGVLPGSWTALAALGAALALLTQALILSNENLSVTRGLTVSLIAIVVGMIGAKLWYRVLHPAPWRDSLRQGWTVDGFLVLAPLTALVLLPLFGLPVGAFLDASAPGIFFAVAIGRIGCFFTGCCAGRCTRSRWGLWSSDRRIGARRLPAQLLESAAGLIIGAVALTLVVLGVPDLDGVVFGASFAVYIGIRQLLLRIRAESRRYSWQRNRLPEARTMRRIGP